MSEAATKWKCAQQVEKELLTMLKKGQPLFEDVDRAIHELRIACEATIFLDFENANKQGVEEHLWSAHSLINKRYRVILSHYRKGEASKLVVEKRKLEKRYVDFIKTSQYFYKGYVQRLASHFDGLDELRRIAHRLSLTTLTADERVKPPPHLQRLIENSCHATLLRLGDLYRYRNDLRTKDRSWEPALGYYYLASELCPNSGSAHNQMAVIALSEGNHLDALYHLYRALAVEEPHPLAKQNLEIEFKKITAAFEKGSAPDKKVDNVANMVLWFVRLHAKLYKGVDFSSHEALENEVLQHLSLALKHQSFEETLQKCVVINMAAGFLVFEKIRDITLGQDPHNIQSAQFFLRFNIRVLLVFMRTLAPELREPSSGEDLPYGPDGVAPAKSSETMTVITRRVLPAIRQYSTWLVCNARFITTATGPVNVYIREMWKAYADMLTDLAKHFSVEDLTAVDYLLEEDQTIIGFKPLRHVDSLANASLYSDINQKIKPRITDQGVERQHPNIEMQSRIRDILLCGVELHSINGVPIFLKPKTSLFIFEESGMPAGSPLPPQNNIIWQKSNSTNGTMDSEMVVYSGELQQNHAMDEIDTISTSHQSMDNYMHQMVDSIVEPSASRPAPSNETSYGMHSRTAHEIFAPISPTGLHASRQGTPKMLPSLPSIWPSPFTPQPNELQPQSPRWSNTGQKQPTYQFSTAQQQLEAAMALDEMTGYGASRKSSIWGNNDSRHNPTSTNVNQLLQENLTQQFGSMPSSNFSESSSLYANTSYQQAKYNGGTAFSRPGPAMTGNNTTTYTGASAFGRTNGLQSSIWDGSQPAGARYAQTPPGRQGNG